MKIRIAKHTDASDLAHAYYQCFSELPTAFLPKLGVGFLTEYHRILLSEANSFALCAENDEGKVVGFVCGTLDAAEHMEALKKNKLRLLLVSLPALMRKPSLVKQVILRMKAPSAASAGTDQATAFVVLSGCWLASWGWLPTDRSGGQALQLLRKWLELSKSLGAVEVWHEVDREVVSKVHRMMGSKIVTEIVTPDGRKRQVMRYDFSKTA